MKKVKFTLLIQAAIMGFSSIASAQAAPANETSSRVIIMNPRAEDAASEVQKKGGKMLRQMEHVRGIVAEVPTAAIRKLRRSLPDAEIVEDMTFHLVTDTNPDKNLRPDVQKSAKAGGPKAPSQPSQQVPWGINRIQARTAHAQATGAGIRVCVIDTGIDSTHPDLKANIVGGRNYVASRNKVNASAWNDDNGHGSHVAGIIAAVDNSIGTVGVAPNAKLIAIKVLNAQGTGYLSDITDGIYECVRQGARVINMSLGAGMDASIDTPMRTAIQSATAQGVKVIAAAGNDGQNISWFIPAGYPETIAVAATDSWDRFPYWSNYGLTSADVSAPGVSIYSTWKSGTYNTINGTSMAAPHVAGVTALAMELGRSTLAVEDLGYATSTQGAGLINALQSLTGN